MTQAPAMRRIAASQLIGSTVDGIALSTAVLYFSIHVGIAATTIGFVLALGAGLALATSVPIGMLADAIGLRTAGIALSGIAALALVFYALADGLPLYVAGACCFLVAQSALNAIRQALVAAATEPTQRIRARAVVYTLMNAGLGLGTVIGVGVLALDSPSVTVGVFYAGAALALVAGVMFATLPRPAREPSVAAARRPGVVALRDRRFMIATGLSAVLGLNMPVLTVLLPLWITTRTGAPEWIAAVAFGLNTLLVLLFQTRTSARLNDDRMAARFARIAAVAFPLACILVGVAALTPAIASAVIVLLAIVSLTAGEILGGLATWHLAFRDTPAEVQGQYQGTFAMASSLARILGPLLALPLVLALGLGGWAVLGAVFAAACVGLVLLAGHGLSVRSE